MDLPTRPPRPWPAGAGTMGDVTLADYIRHCRPALTHLSGIFHNTIGPATAPPILRHGVPNTVLVFPGFFNPPTANHAELLQYVTRNAGQDLNVIGSVIVIRDELEAVMRLRELGEPVEALSLDNEQRATIWRGHGVPVDWVWIVSREECKWEDVRRALAHMAESDGFSIKFLLLCGPENFRVTGGDRPEDPARWGCSGWITSDIGRCADFVHRYTGEPSRKSRGCSVWKPVDPKGKDVRAIARRKFMHDGPEDLRFVSGAQVREEGHRIVGTAVRDWMCRRITRPRGPVRFVASPPGHVRSQISSSSVRAVIRLTKIEDLPSLENVIAHKALHMRYLLNAAAEWKTEAFADEFDWAAWGARVDRHVAASRATANFMRQGASVPAYPDEEAFYRKDMQTGRESVLLGEVSKGTPVSAVRSTLFTHAEGADVRASLRPSVREIWGANTYLNEEEQGEAFEGELEWTPETRLDLPKI